MRKYYFAKRILLLSFHNLVTFVLIFSQQIQVEGLYLQKNETHNNFKLKKMTDHYFKLKNDTVTSNLSFSSIGFIISSTNSNLLKAKKNDMDLKNGSMKVILMSYNKDNIRKSHGKENENDSFKEQKYINHQKDNKVKGKSDNKENNETLLNVDDFDYEYDDNEDTTEDETNYVQHAETAVLFLVEIYGTFYGLSYGIYQQVNYFYAIYITKDREPEHLGALNNNNITIANP